VEAGEQLLAIARQGDDPGQLLEAHHTLWPTLVGMGEAKRALAHIESGVALYDRERHGAYALLYGGHDPGVCCRYFRSMSEWALGYPEQALASAYEALRLAETLGHAFTTVNALWAAIYIQYQRGDRAAAVANAERALTLIEAHGFSTWTCETTVLFLASRSEPPDIESLNALHRQMMGAPASSWRRVLSGCILASLYGGAGAPAQGLEMLASLGDPEGGGHYGSEVARLEGELRRRVAPPIHDDAARCFERALQIARQRDAKSFELRAATSLAWLRRDQGRRDDARRALADVYGWFTEGFDTQDLRTAKALLDELASG